MKSKRTKALDISPSVRRRVWERDGGVCVLCGSPEASPNAHFISRAQGGLGIEENIITLCWTCHMAYDQTAGRNVIRHRLKHYLMDRYPEWDEAKLYYQKGKWHE